MIGKSCRFKNVGGHFIKRLVASISQKLRSLYDWVEKWSESPYGLYALFFIAVAESSFFPIPPDVLLIAMGVGAPKKSLKFATVCLVGSLIGGAIGYGMGWGFWSALDQFFFSYVPGFTPELFEKVVQIYHDNAFFAIFSAGFSPIPYKVFTLSAGVAQIPFGVFFLASLLGRALRFFAVAGMLYAFGPKVKVTIDKYFDRLALLFVILGIAGFAAIKLFF